MSVVVENLVKEYGQQKAVNEISFRAIPGQITGFLGPNGAGKSTTMKIATGYLTATSGEVIVGGEKVSENPFHAKKNIGYLPEHNPLYYDMYVKEFLRFVGAAYGLGTKFSKQRVADVIDKVGLQQESHKKIKALSKGYKQRVGLAQALLPDPSVLILDEPTTGLDPNQIEGIRNLIREVAQDKTLIFSTHIMQEVEAVCDHVVIINKGKIVADDSLSNLTKTSTQSDRLTVQFESEISISELNEISGVLESRQVDNFHYILSTTDANVKNEVLKKVADKNWPLISVKSSGGSLEEIFRKLTTKD